MADDIDMAQDREQLDRELAVRAARGRQATADAALAALPPPGCIDCDGPIEPERWQVLRGCTSRCAACAQVHEQRMQTYAPQARRA